MKKKNQYRSDFLQKHAVVVQLIQKKKKTYIDQPKIYFKVSKETSTSIQP